VALLFYLQPITRGWARYQGRLRLRPAQTAPSENLDSAALRQGRQSLGQVDYWSDKPLDRFAWVKDLLRGLEERRWPHKADIGWSEYDIEIYDTHWSKLQLATVVEEWGQGKRLLRCRLRGRWSLRAKVAFWSLLGLELLVLGVAGPHRLWLWLLLLTLPGVAWLLRRQQRKLQSIICIFLDETAKEWNLAKMRPQGEAQRAGLAATEPKQL
jgi:hypothetical protein